LSGSHAGEITPEKFRNRLLKRFGGFDVELMELI
jgi:hypothetical protein